jgi:predicted metallo-beta-lactamase superfamily hydrolase
MGKSLGITRKQLQRLATELGCQEKDLILHHKLLFKKQYEKVLHQLFPSQKAPQFLERLKIMEDILA